MNLSYKIYTYDKFPDFKVYYITLNGRQIFGPLFSLNEVDNELEKLIRGLE